jgi:hypothetical protein
MLSLTCTGGVTTQVGTTNRQQLQSRRLLSFSPLSSVTLQSCERETQIYSGHTFPTRIISMSSSSVLIVKPSSSVSSSANPFCNTMHKYAACPLQDRHLTPTRPNQDPNDSQSHHGLTEDSEDAQNHPSLDLSWGYHDDSLASSTPSFAQAKPLETCGQSPPSEAFASSMGRLGRAFSGGYSRWKASWRLQTAIIGFFLLCICNPCPQPVNY